MYQWRTQLGPPGYVTMIVAIAQVCAQ